VDVSTTACQSEGSGVDAAFADALPAPAAPSAVALGVVGS
jgi:hypothetical protein